MAIKKDIELKVVFSNEKLRHDEVFSEVTGLSPEMVQKSIVKDAYCVVDNINGDKEKMYYQMVIYVDDNKDKILDSFKYSFQPDTSVNSLNYHTQCYEHAKTLKEYENAVDC